MPSREKKTAKKRPGGGKSAGKTKLPSAPTAAKTKGTSTAKRKNSDNVQSPSKKRRTADQMTIQDSMDNLSRRASTAGTRNVNIDPPRPSTSNDVQDPASPARSRSTSGNRSSTSDNRRSTSGNRRSTSGNRRSTSVNQSSTSETRTFSTGNRRSSAGTPKGQSTKKKLATERAHNTYKSVRPTKTQKQSFGPVSVPTMRLVEDCIARCASETLNGFSQAQYTDVQSTLDDLKARILNRLTKTKVPKCTTNYKKLQSAFIPLEKELKTVEKQRQHTEKCITKAKAKRRTLKKCMEDAGQDTGHIADDTHLNANERKR